MFANRKIAVRRLSVIALDFPLAPLCFASVFGQAKPLKQIYVGVASVSMGNIIIIIYITKEARLFEKHGLYADPVAMRGSGEASKAMIGDSIQMAPIATPTVINADLAGALSEYGGDENQLRLCGCRASRSVAS